MFCKPLRIYQSVKPKIGFSFPQLWLRRWFLFPGLTVTLMDKTDASFFNRRGNTHCALNQMTSSLLGGICGRRVLYVYNCVCTGVSAHVCKSMQTLIFNYCI